jgi:hypothetical protein
MMKISSHKHAGQVKKNRDSAGMSRGMIGAGTRWSILEANRGAVLPVALKGKEVTHIEVAAMTYATAILSTSRDETHHSGSGKPHSFSASAVGTTFTVSHWHHPLGRNSLPLLLLGA